MIEYVKDVRRYDPGIGGRKLWQMYRSEFGRENALGRDRFESIVRNNGLCIRYGTRKPRTTDSRHAYPVYPDLVKNLIPDAPDTVWVSDITYQKIWDGEETYHFCYISLITDYYTKEIIGYAVGASLSACYPIAALRMALRRLTGTSGLPIHHSDRGVQYASYEYVSLLKQFGLAISMTERGDPKENAVAERVNNTLKNELFKSMEFRTIEQVKKALEKAVDFYNNRRPHMSLDMMTPAKAAMQKGEIKKCWTSYRENHLRTTHNE